MIHICDKQTSLLLVAIAASLQLVLGTEKCLLNGELVPCPEELEGISDGPAPAPSAAAPPAPAPSAAAPPAPAPSAAAPALSISQGLSAAVAPAATPAPGPAATPAIMSASPVSSTTEDPQKKTMKIVGGALGISAAVAAAGAGIGVAIHQSQMAHSTTTLAPVPTAVPGDSTDMPAISARGASGDNESDTGIFATVENVTQGSSSGSFNEIEPGEGSLKFMKEGSWASSGALVWFIILGLVVLACIGCLIGICASCCGPKKSAKKKVRAAAPAPSGLSSRAEQAPLLMGPSSFPPPAPKNQMGTRMDVLPTSTMYNGPAMAGQGGYFPSGPPPSPGAYPVSPLALETTPALAPPPPPPKPNQGYYPSQPGSYGQQVPSYGQMWQGGNQQSKPSPMSYAQVPTQPLPGAGRPDLQTMPPGAVRPSPYSNTQTMQTMQALPQQPGYGYR